MTAIGARYKWQDGKILHAARYWKSPTMRRLPRIMVEDRALEVGIKMYIDDMWMVFEETETKSRSINIKNAIPLQFYAHRYQLLPEKINNTDTYDWLKDTKNALLVWALENKYFALPVKR